jgi:hypothetical protein
MYARRTSWGGAKDSLPSTFFLPLEGGEPEVVTPWRDSTPTCPAIALATADPLLLRQAQDGEPVEPHGGERENEVKSDFISTAHRKIARRGFLRGYYG